MESEIRFWNKYYLIIRDLDEFLQSKVEFDDIDINLDMETDYPFRHSLTNTPRCYTCQFNKNYNCIKGHNIKYPTFAKEHNCSDFRYKEDCFSDIQVLPKDKIKIYHGLMDKLEECNNCGHNHKNRCEGVGWSPFKKEPKCEFFINKNLICKYAIPYFQYSNHIRNNHCRLPPHLRDGYQKQSWQCNCPQAHEQPKSLKCYIPKKKD